MDFLTKLFSAIIKDNKRQKRWKAFTTFLAGMVVFTTTYGLILPAITIDIDDADESAGFFLEEDIYEDEEETYFEDIFWDDDESEDDFVDEENFEDDFADGYAGEEDEFIITEDVDDGNAWDEQIAEDDDDSAASDDLSYTNTELFAQCASDVYSHAVSARIVYDSDAFVPDGTELNLTEISSITDDNPARFQNLNSSAQAVFEILHPSQAVRDALFIDFSLFRNLETIEPSAPVSVEIYFPASVFGQYVDVLHFEGISYENAAEMDLLPIEISAETFRNSDGSIERVTFTADSFSIFGIILSEDAAEEEDATFSVRDDVDDAASDEYSQDDASSSIDEYISDGAASGQDNDENAGNHGGSIDDASAEDSSQASADETAESTNESFAESVAETDETDRTADDENDSEAPAVPDNSANTDSDAASVVEEIAEVTDSENEQNAEESGEEDSSSADYPAQDFHATTAEVEVNVHADEGAFPSGTTMTVQAVSDEETIAAITEAAESEVETGRVNRIHAVDISFFNQEGTEIEPLIPVQIEMTSDEVQENEQAIVVHVDHDGNAEALQDAEVVSKENSAFVEVTENGEYDADGEESEAPDVSFETGETEEEDDDVEGEDNGDAVEWVSDENEFSVTDESDFTSEDSADANDDWNSSADDVDVDGGWEHSDDDTDADSDTVVFMADAFSVYAIVYTVDFSYSVNGQTYEFSLPGGGFVSFRQLVEALGIAGGEDAQAVDEEDIAVPDADEDTDVLVLSEVVVSEAAKKFVSDVENVEFSKPDLVWVGKIDEETLVGALKEENGLEVQYSAELTEEQIEEINGTVVEPGDWALISMLPFTSEESLTVTMKNGDVFTIKVTDVQASDPLGLNGQTFAIMYSDGSVSGQFMSTTLSAGSLVSIGNGSVSSAGDAIKWTFVYASEAFDETGGYYLYSPALDKYLNYQGGAFSFVSSTTVTDDKGKTKEVIPAAAFKVTFDETKIDGVDTHSKGRYRLSISSDESAGFLNYSNYRFNISNTDSNSVWFSLKDSTASDPSSTPGTIGTWDIKSDGIVLKMFDYSGTITRTAENGGTWINYDDPWTWTQLYPGDPGYDTAYEGWRGYYREFSYEYGRWKNGEWIPNYETTSMNIDAVWGGDTSDSELRNGSGINAGRTIVFSGSGLGSNSDTINQFTGEWDGYYKNDTTGSSYYAKRANPGIVQSTLGTDGYPQLSSISNEAYNDDGSLAYLFDPSKASAGTMTAYTGENGTGLSGLLRKDANGYYYYDSEQNYARLIGNELVLYSDTYKKDDATDGVERKEKIGFFPFDPYNNEGREEKGPHSYTSDDIYDYDHQFGMSMETNFVYPTNGVIPQTGDPMIFEFSGDDDLWVFIDGKLVMDIGGVHQPVKGTINFKTKTVTVENYYYNSGSDQYELHADTKTFDEIFGEGVFNDSSFSTHKMKMFYLERGGCDSNLAIRFNLLMCKSLTVAKKLNGLTAAEREKYLDDWFQYELALRHNAGNLDIDLDDDDAVWSDQSWRTDFQLYNTGDTENINTSKNYTLYKKQDGTEVEGVPISDGQIRLKAGESVTINQLPVTDIFYLAEEDELDMNQFETPHAERLYQNEADLQDYEEEVSLHEDSAQASNISDWETKPYALMDTERLVYTNTVQERNIDVEKIWADGKAADSHNEIQFILKATVEGEDYTTATGHNSINAQWTETVEGTTTTTTEDVITSEEKRFTLSSDNNWHISFEHLPRKTESATGEGKDIIYSVVEVLPDGYSEYTVTYNGPEDTGEAYLDLFKFWPDDNSNHEGENAEHIYTYVKRSDGKYLTGERDTNGEYRYTGVSDTKEGATKFLITSKTELSNVNMSTENQYSMFDYSARINRVPLTGGTEEEPVTYTYSLEQAGDEDTTTTGIVLFTRPKEEIEIVNSLGEISIEKEWLDENGEPLGEGDRPDGIAFKVYQLKHEHEWVKYDAETDTWISVDGEGWYVEKEAAEDEEGLQKRICKFGSCGNYTEERVIAKTGSEASTAAVSSTAGTSSRGAAADKNLTLDTLLSNLELSGLGVKNPATGDTLTEYSKAGVVNALETKSSTMFIK